MSLKKSRNDLRENKEDRKVTNSILTHSLCDLTTAEEVDLRTVFRTEGFKVHCISPSLSSPLAGNWLNKCQLPTTRVAAYLPLVICCLTVPH